MMLYSRQLPTSTKFLGVIHQPFWNYQLKDDNKLGRTFHGVVGCGYGGKLNPSEAPKGQRIVTSTRSHSTGMLKIRYQNSKRRCEMIFLGLVSQVIESCSPTEVLKVGGKIRHRIE